MKVLQTIGGFGERAGGTSTSTYDLLAAIHKIRPEDKIDILTPDVSSDDRMMGTGEDWIKVVANDYRTPIAFSRNLRNFIHQSDYDIYHTNGLWMHVNHLTCREARKKDRPYVITPHGMLYPEALARSSWKKWPFRKLWFDQDIEGAAAIHATCEREAENVSNFGYKGPIAIIPNLVNIPSFADEIYHKRIPKSNEGKIKIGFLGRLHNIKKIELLIKGLALSKYKDVDLYVMGKGNENYELFLKQEAKSLNLSERIHFPGFINGIDKFEKLAELDAIFLPSEMENFGMIVPEALIVGTPVMASLGTPWISLEENRCGWWRDNSPESIAKVIEEVANLSPQEHKEMGARGRKFVMENFSADKVASKMIALYQWLAGDISKPEFVYP